MAIIIPMLHHAIMSFFVISKLLLPADIKCNLSIACSQLKFHRVYHKIWKTKILWLYIIIAFRLLIFVDRGVVRIRRVIIRAIFIIHMFGTFYIRLSFLKATVLVTGYSRKPGLKQTQCHWNLRGVSQTNKPTTTL